MTAAHFYGAAMEAAMLAPKAELSMFPWKVPTELIPLAVRQVPPFPLNPDYRRTVSTRRAAWLDCGLSRPWCADLFPNRATNVPHSTGFRPLLKSRPADLLRKNGAEGGI